ncbi:hypothetical protein GDO86_002627 [Hymenochirus boettgeri]|uniref:Uncharacterized protein n=1 Tax=Hymenochirus boettgeri TaxID=247094 RepID=A0A8T2JXU4_9PIPI|nr:hypothetical protein GDO86_002627 [Hymenochirus boettgeri]
MYKIISPFVLVTCSLNVIMLPDFKVSCFLTLLCLCGPITRWGRFQKQFNYTNTLRSPLSVKMSAELLFIG